MVNNAKLLRPPWTRTFSQTIMASASFSNLYPDLSGLPELRATLEHAKAWQRHGCVFSYQLCLGSGRQHRHITFSIVRSLTVVLRWAGNIWNGKRRCIEGKAWRWIRKKETIVYHTQKGWSDIRLWWGLLLLSQLILLVPPQKWEALQYHRQEDCVFHKLWWSRIEWDKKLCLHQNHSYGILKIQ